MSHAVEVDPRIWELRPDFVVSIVRARRLENGPSDSFSTSLFRRAEERAREALKGAEPAAQPHIAAWREAYRAFGTKAQRTPCSAEALLRRVVSGEGLPPINRLVDLYNALSVEFLIPVGGEDLSRIVGPSRLTIATGAEPFDTLRSGEPTVEQPAAGEVVWLDDAGVTCRRWNWRQCVRTRLTEPSTEAFFVLERLEPFPLPMLEEATNALVTRLGELCPAAEVETWTMGLGRAWDLSISGDSRSS
jgi:DNA/RNA-binding domain of Phe-tRNA-synthetase-like protein